MTVIAWLIKKCPNFYFLPSLYCDQIFTKRGVISEKMSLAYWESVGFTPLPLYECAESEATHWVVNGEYGLFDKESAESARYLKKLVVSVKLST